MSNSYVNATSRRPLYQAAIKPTDTYTCVYVYTHAVYPLGIRDTRSILTYYSVLDGSTAFVTPSLLVNLPMAIIQGEKYYNGKGLVFALLSNKYKFFFPMFLYIYIYIKCTF